MDVMNIDDDNDEPIGYRDRLDALLRIVLPGATPHQIKLYREGERPIDLIEADLR